MARFDDPTGLTRFDSGVYFDGYTPPAQKGKMALIALNLRDMNPAERAQFGAKVKTDMTGNAHFPTPDPTLADLEAAITEVNQAVAEANVKRQAALQATTVVNQKSDRLGTVLTNLAHYVEKTAAGDKAILQSSGMTPRAERTATVELEQVKDLSVTAGDEQGELDLHWDPVPRAKYYEYQTSPAADTGVWNPCSTGTASKATIKGLTSGCKIWVRVRAHGPNGLVGAWSDPAVKIVP